MFDLGIETYLAVVETGSLSKAAARLNIAQTTVSKRLKALEEQMGMTLIERSKGVRQMRLTPSGEAFWKLAEQSNRLTREARILKSQGPRLALVIAAVDSLNVFVLPDVYRSLHTEQPMLSLEIRTQHSDEMYALVERRQVDVAFTLLPHAHPNVVMEPLFATPMVVLSYSGGEGGNVSSVNDMTEGDAQVEWISPEALDPEHELFIAWGSRFVGWHDQLWDPVLPSRIHLDSAHLVFSLLQDPRQWAIVPRWVADAARPRGNYRVRFLTDQPPDYVCYKLSHRYPTALTENSLRLFEPYCKHIGASLNQRADQRVDHAPHRAPPPWHQAIA